MSPSMSKRRDFTHEELELLRAFARDQKKKHRWTGEELGKVLGTRQQNASAFVKDGATQGLSRISANRLASAADFRNAEDLLQLLKSEAAIAEGIHEVASVWSARETGKKIAEAMGVADKAIATVIAQRKSPGDAKRPPKWWVGMFINQETQMVADGEVRR